MVLGTQGQGSTRPTPKKAAIYIRSSDLRSRQFQLESMTAWCLQNGFEVVRVFAEHGLVPSKKVRREIQKGIRAGSYDLLVIPRFSSIFSSLDNAIDFLSNLGDGHLYLLDDKLPLGKLTSRIFLALKIMRSDLSRQKIKNGLAIAKILGISNVGRPRTVSPEVIKTVLELRSQNLSVREISKKLGTVSKSAIQRIIREHYHER